MILLRTVSSLQTPGTIAAELELEIQLQLGYSLSAVVSVGYPGESAALLI